MVDLRSSAKTRQPGRSLSRPSSLEDSGTLGGDETEEALLKLLREAPYAVSPPAC